MPTATLAAPGRVRAALVHAKLYRKLGYNPLPSDPERKKPLCKFAHWWETPAPADLFERFPTSNVQVMTGRVWDLAVLDLDGPEAVDLVKSWKLPRTWTVYHTRGGRSSRHLWFRLPAGLPERRKRVVWARWDDATGAWAKHSAVELLIDRSLIVAPPSVHPKTGNVYGFETGPHNMRLPALLPCHVLDMPAVEPPAHARPPEPPRVDPRRFVPRGDGPGTVVPLGHLLDCLTDKAAVARDCWGLRFARDRQASDGWVSCHDPFREDNNPSARFHLETGGLWLPGEKVIPFCVIPVRLGLALDWKDVVNDLAARYSVRPR